MVCDIVGYELDEFVYDNLMYFVCQCWEWMVIYGVGLLFVEQILLCCDGMFVEVEVFLVLVQFGWCIVIQVVVCDIMQCKQVEQVLCEFEVNYWVLVVEIVCVKELLCCEKIVLEFSLCNVLFLDLLVEVCCLVEVLFDDGVMCFVLFSGDGEYIMQVVVLLLFFIFLQLLVGIVFGFLVGLCGMVMFLNKIVVVEDIDVDLFWDGYCDIVVLLGLCVCWLMFICGDNVQMIGVMGIYYDILCVFMCDVMGLFDGIIDIIGVVVQKVYIVCDL